jgi:hypothetical protein
LPTNSIYNLNNFQSIFTSSFLSTGLRCLKYDTNAMRIIVINVKVMPNKITGFRIRGPAHSGPKIVPIPNNARCIPLI